MNRRIMLTCHRSSCTNVTLPQRAPKLMRSAKPQYLYYEFIITINTSDCITVPFHMAVCICVYFIHIFGKNHHVYIIICADGTKIANTKPQARVTTRL